MKIARTIGLAAVAALALMASLGAGSAFAAETTLCKTNTDSPYCQSNDRYPANTTLKAQSHDVVFRWPVLEFHCESTLEGKTAAEAGSPLSVTVSNLTFEKCESACAVTAKNLPYAGSLTHSEGANGSLSFGNGGKGQPFFRVECHGLIECNYIMPAMTFKGGNPAQLTLPKTTLTEVGKPGILDRCPKKEEEEPSSIEAAEYSVTSPNPAYVAEPVLGEEWTRLCKVEMAKNNYCITENAYPYGTTIEAEAPELKIATTSGNFICGKTLMTAKTQALGAEPLPLGNVEFTMEKCNFPGAIGCKVTTSKPSTGAGIRNLFNSLEHPWLQLYVSWEFLCGPYIGCIFEFEGAVAPAAFSNGNPATFSWKNVWLPVKPVNNMLCPKTDELSATFTVTSPKPLYAT